VYGHSLLVKDVKSGSFFLVEMVIDKPKQSLSIVFKAEMKRLVDDFVGYFKASM
jgi:hypothetical protein